MASTGPAFGSRPPFASHTSATSIRRRESSFPSSQARGYAALSSPSPNSGLGAWGTPVPFSEAHGVANGAAATGAAAAASSTQTQTGTRKKGPSLSFALSGERDGEKDAKDEIHPLKYTWDVYFSHRAVSAKGQQQQQQKKEVVVEKDAPAKSGKEKESREEWEGTVVKLGGFSSVESFHPFFSHLTPPSALPASLSSTDANAPPAGSTNVVSDLNVFRSPIAPAWEDASNAGGGRWVLRLRKGVSDRVWEEVVYALIGDRISGKEDDGDGANRVNGVVLSVRKEEDILSLWCAPTNRSEREAIKESFKTALQPLLSAEALESLQIDYKPHPVSSMSGTHHRNGDSSSHHHHHHHHHHSSSHHHSHHHSQRERGESHRDRERSGEGASNLNAPTLSGASDRRPRREGGGFSSYRAAAERDAEREYGERRERTESHPSGAANGAGRPERRERDRELTWGRG